MGSWYDVEPFLGNNRIYSGLVYGTNHGSYEDSVNKEKKKSFDGLPKMAFSYLDVFIILFLRYSLPGSSPDSENLNLNL